MLSTPADDLSPLYTAARARLGLVAALCVVAAAGWVWAARTLRGMDGGPWSAPGGVGWFLGVWVVMMAAMMLPSVAPTVALYARVTTQESALLPWLFAAGYLLVWGAAGLAAYGVGEAGSGAGRALSGAVLVAAAAYELTPLKQVCLRQCRRPSGALRSRWPAGRFGALRTGARNGAWCVGCCWALMAALFALGAMNLWWMALVAVIVAGQKTLPWLRVVSYGTAGVLLGLGILVLATPDLLPLR